MNADRWRGIFAIPQTPFDAQGRLDEDSLRREVEFCLRAGAHGLVAPVVAGEFYALADRERERVVALVVEQARGRAPVIAGVTAASREQAAELARQAEAAGADGLIAMPPYAVKAGLEGALDYYRALSGAARLPIMIQNAPPPLGTPLAPAAVARICREVERVDTVKEETLPTGRHITEILELGGPSVRGVFGGAAARWMLPELARGACGFMPACQFTDVYVQIWDLWQAGEREAARALFNRLLPLINLEGLLGVAFCKEVLVQRGVIAHAYTRQPDAPRLDRCDLDELERCLRDVQQYLIEW